MEMIFPSLFKEKREEKRRRRRETMVPLEKKKKNVYNPREERDRSTVYALKNDATSGLTNFILGDLISCRQDALHGDIRVSSL